MLQQYDPRNAGIQIWVNGHLVPRQEAKVSVFDSVVQGGDAVWEGIRLYKGKVFCLSRHLQRMRESAKALAFADIPAEAEIREAIFKTLQANGMEDGVHIRLTLSRGEKITSGMDPRLNKSGSTLIVLAEWKPPVYPENGIRLVTASIRRNSPIHLDSRIHHNNLLNNILAKIEANYAGADDAIMLDADGFVSETNATNLFMVKEGTLFTPFADACLPGITRSVVIRLAGELGIPFSEARLSLTQFYNADEVFVSGTMGELTQVNEIDGRKMEDFGNAGILGRLRAAFYELVEKEGEEIGF